MKAPNPFLLHIAELRQALVTSVTRSDIERVVQALVNGAQHGDVQAAKVIRDIITTQVSNDGLSPELECELPTLDSPANCVAAMNLIVRKTVDGSISVNSATALMRLVRTSMQAIDASGATVSQDLLEEDKRFL